MKTVPTVHLADATDIAALPELSEQVRLALGDIAGVAREGLLAMSVAAGLGVMQAMFEAEITAVAGPKGKHDPEARRPALRRVSPEVRISCGIGNFVPAGHEILIWSPSMVTCFSASGRVAGPVFTVPSVMLYLLPWHGQLIVPAATSETMHPWCVHTAVNALNWPGSGCVTTTF
jgi:hypothetical protein